MAKASFNLVFFIILLFLVSGKCSLSHTHTHTESLKWRCMMEILLAGLPFSEVAGEVRKCKTNEDCKKYCTGWAVCLDGYCSCNAADKKPATISYQKKADYEKRMWSKVTIPILSLQINKIELNKWAVSWSIRQIDFVTAPAMSRTRFGLSRGYFWSSFACLVYNF